MVFRKHKYSGVGSLTHDKIVDIDERASQVLINLEILEKLSSVMCTRVYEFS